MIAVQWKETVVDTIRKRKLQLFGHICRMRLLKIFLFGMVKGERRQGRRARRWIDHILKWCGKDLRDVAKMTEDRIEWRRFVTNPYGPCWSWDQKKKDDIVCKLSTCADILKSMRTQQDNDINEPGMAHGFHVFQFPVLLSQLFLQILLCSFHLFKLAPRRLTSCFQQLNLLVQRLHLNAQQKK